jgi:hypothetical protein
MANRYQSTVSIKALPLRPDDDGLILSSRQRRKAAWNRTVVMLAAWLEIVVGVSLLVDLNSQSQGLFGVTPDGVGVPIARFAGIGLISLGIACLPSKATEPQRGAVRGLFVFNLGATVVFAGVAMASPFRGVVLVPVVILHAVITIVLIPILQSVA